LVATRFVQNFKGDDKQQFSLERITALTWKTVVGKRCLSTLG
jgi:hypothetical protein